MQEKQINKEGLSPEVIAYIASLEQKIDKLQNTVENLNEQLVKRNKMLFGKSSEKTEYMEGQLNFFNEAELEYDKGAKEPTPETITIPEHKRKAKRSKEEIQKELEHIDIEEDLEESEKICEECGTELKYIGRELVRQELHIEPAKAYVINRYKKVYKCEKCEAETDEAVIKKAEVPPLPVKKSMAAASAIAYVMVEKYQMGTPLYRLEQYLNSRGIYVNRNAMARWVILSSLLFEPIIKYFYEILMSMEIIHSDETSLMVLKRDGVQTNKQSTMWVTVSGKYEEHQVALYKYFKTKSQESADKILGKYTGTLISDGYQVYDNLTKCTHSCCWAHCRRKFLDAVPKGRTEGKAYECLQIITRMLNEDKQILDSTSLEEKILEQRQKKVKPILDEFWSYLKTFVPAPGSHLETAVCYAINHKKQLSMFADSGKLESTNNRAERAVKPFVMSRKNFLFSDTEKGADASACVFSIVETAKMNNLDVYGYLLFLLSELPKFGKEPTQQQIESVLPWSDQIPNYCKNKS